MNPLFTPILSIQRLDKRYLGHPFTKCFSGEAMGYTESRCNYERLLVKMCHICHCHPGLIKSIILNPEGPRRTNNPRALLALLGPLDFNSNFDPEKPAIGKIHIYKPNRIFNFTSDSGFKFWHLGGQKVAKNSNYS